MRTDILAVKERHIEQHLIRQVENVGGYIRKFKSENSRSVPDRIIVLNGWTVFVECKRPGEKLTDNQLLEAIKIVARGGIHFTSSEKEHNIFIVDLLMMA
jgi:hypothetical protein